MAQATTVPSAPTGLSAQGDIRLVKLTWSASASGAVTYNVYRSTSGNGEAGSTAISTGLTTPTFIDISVPYGQVVYYVVTAQNSAGESAFSNEAFAYEPLELLGINSGGGGIAGFLPDCGFIGGTTYAVPPSYRQVDTSNVLGSEPYYIYQTNRWANFEGGFFYVLTGMQPLSSYKVRLDFAEIYWPGPGYRLFNVSINGAPKLANYDIAAAAGGSYKAVAQDIPTTSDVNGNLWLDFETVLDNAQVNGIELFQNVPDFAVTTSQNSVFLLPGGSSPTTINVSTINNFSGNLSLSASAVDASGNPVSGLSASFQTLPLSVSGSGSAENLTVTANSNVASGNYKIIVLATSGTEGHPNSINRTVTIPVSVGNVTLAVRRVGAAKPDPNNPGQTLPADFASGISLAAGAQASAEHEADVQVAVTLPNGQAAPAGIPLTLNGVIVSGGQGPNDPPNNVTATLALGSGVTDANGLITFPAAFQSGNRTEPTVIRADYGNGSGPTATLTQVWNELGSPWNYDTFFDYDVPSTISYSMAFTDENNNTIPITQHHMSFVTTNITGVEWNETVGDYEPASYSGTDITANGYDGVVSWSAVMQSNGVYSGTQTVSSDEDSTVKTYTVDNGDGTTSTYPVDFIDDSVSFDVDDNDAYNAN